jgi:prepilin-type N-terminal cleavage/methylation domain-containing protein
MDQGLIERVRVRSQLGFTLIEMMITVAVIAILAMIVVPQFTKESRKTKSATEIAPMFAELSVKEEQYKVDRGVYLDAATCPATTSPSGSPAVACITAGTPGSDWYQLRVNPPEQTLRCTYEITTGTTSGVVDPIVGFTFTAPAANWYYILATCDMDGNAGDATYFMSSVDATLQKQNEGK